MPQVRPREIQLARLVPIVRLQSQGGGAPAAETANADQFRLDHSGRNGRYHPGHCRVSHHTPGQSAKLDELGPNRSRTRFGGNRHWVHLELLLCSTLFRRPHGEFDLESADVVVRRNSPAAQNALAAERWRLRDDGGGLHRFPGRRRIVLVDL